MPSVSLLRRLAPAVVHPTLVLSIGLTLNLAARVDAQCFLMELNAGNDFDDSFSGAIAIDDDVAVVSDTVQSLAHVYERHGLEWSEAIVLEPPVSQAGDAFSRSVAIDGSVIAIGAPQRDTTNGVNSGAVYVYRHISGQWLLEAELIASDGDASDFFGFSVSVDNERIVVGAANDEAEGLFGVGSAYIFGHEAIWSEESMLVNPDPGNSDVYGYSVSIRADRILIGARGDHPSGTTFVYQRTENTWALETTLTASDGDPDARFGTSVVLNDAADVAVIGAPEQDGQLGAAYVYRDVDGAGWIEEAKLGALEPAGPFPFFGASVAIDDVNVLVGAPFDFAGGFESGAAHLFRLEERRWLELTKLLPPDSSQGCFGTSVSLDLDYGLIGSTGESAPGRAYAYGGVGGRDCDENDQLDTCEIINGGGTDKNSNGILDSCESQGDLNGDAAVNVIDLVIVMVAWGPCPLSCEHSCNGDADWDCVVGIGDLLTVLINWKEPQ